VLLVLESRAAGVYYNLRVAAQHKRRRMGRDEPRSTPLTIRFVLTISQMRPAARPNETAFTRSSRRGLGQLVGHPSEAGDVSAL